MTKIRLSQDFFYPVKEEKDKERRKDKKRQQQEMANLFGEDPIDPPKPKKDRKREKERSERKLPKKESVKINYVIEIEVLNSHG